MTTNPAAGHNIAPLFSDPEALAEYLREYHAADASRTDELLAGGTRFHEAHAEIDWDDEETIGRAGDFVKQITAHTKALNTAREGAKRPYLEGSRGVDGFFKGMSDKLDALKKSVSVKITDALREREARERRAREELERQARAEAERQRREQEEAERRAAEAEAAGKADEAQRQIDNAVTSEELHRQAQADVTTAAKAADAKPADLSRTRGDLGSVSSLRAFWDFRNLDRAAVDLEALRAHLPLDAIEKALRGYIKANKSAAGVPPIAGVEFYENKQARVG